MNAKVFLYYSKLNENEFNGSNLTISNVQVIWFYFSRIKFVWKVSFEDHGLFLKSSEPQKSKEASIREAKLT